MGFQFWEDFVERHQVDVNNNYPFMGSPYKIIFLTALYLWFVKKAGPKLMANRPAYELKNAMLVYNILQVLANIYVFYCAVDVAWGNPWYEDWGCMRFYPKLATKKDGFCSYLYYMLKIFDFTDTIFMVLRKRYKQITVLHVYHHALMALSGYFGARFIGGGHCFLLGFINLFVHAVMYSYYFVAALNSNVKHSLWWKKHITHLQLAQFITLVLHFARALLRPDCDQNRGLMWFCLIQNIVMLILFSNFYIQCYVVQKKPKKSVK